MAATYTKTCPDCGAENDSNDLFCKDCGTSLAMVGNTTQQTSAFKPIINTAETQTTMITPAEAPAAPAYAAAPAAVSPTNMYVPRQESSRGAVLGWLAAMLMLVIVAAFIWSSVISEATRDRLIGFF